ncbi:MULTISPECIES: LGFP repeat-containing protein [Nocardia]|uniref:LGFP repeat-containing protein n=1 Tax=Nocardia TaxID=1817 RepID=UPI0018933906|nr:MULTISPECIES: esterase [Nocardia]MBF6350635.1 esterase [Nocardia flavorosea]
MHHFARRSAGFTIALAAAGLLVAGCGDDDTSVSDTVGSLTSQVMPGENTGEGNTPTGAPAEGSPGAEASPTETTGAEGSPTPDQDPNADAGETTVQTPDGTEVTVSGSIYQKYTEAGGPAGTLGMPEGEEQVAGDGGRYQNFVGGTIFFSEETGAHIVWGDIREAWEANGGAEGELGFPISDEQDTPEGKMSEFEGGTITWNSSDRSTTVTQN